MHYLDKIYINGEFVTPDGDEYFELYNPATEEVIGKVRLANDVDAQRAISAAKAAFGKWSKTSKAERITVLQRMYSSVAAREEELLEAIITEYGAPQSRSRWMAKYPADVIAQAIEALENFEFIEQAGEAQIIMTPVGVAGLITPWNSDAGFICNKLATAMAAGCTAVIKPSEMSAIQTQIVMEALHEAQVPAGVFNIITGRGEVVGDVINHHPDIAKISFTGSTAVGKHIVERGAQSLKRITLELGGKSPTLILEDADLTQAIPLALQAGFINSGQACIAGTRILVPHSRLEEFRQMITVAVNKIQSGNPRDPDTEIGPMVSNRQWKRVQDYIRLGLSEGAILLAGGEGRPEGYTQGWYVKPTIFLGNNQMRIAQEEIFGPVLMVIPYENEADAIAIANDTAYGLSALVLSGDRARGVEVARHIDAGRVLVNTLAHEPKAPFGGFKQSGLGREMGKWGIQTYLEPKTLMVG
ncbi:aldehyde dehydrogenase family protein [Limnobaculum zhutongyuii]|uniref:aldehyde dehydrogenase (NAD(+)) n=1 Tax=Limnobaculum zhutongyuii TaxID=2498113 RepID=A0A411WMV5_9GAMM|nr:aldehyde dehydrogenase family protein [Limnobaculum zhutongyuii]QBH97563.1 aldehyde dehydrogenase family protein [Limnobaculum zhutongyuii]TQS91037.1 aldehyde dehydrogenase family protein [Limnobaculum zhutongyuii]